jgi:small subunit ribosomal protein S20
MPITKSAKKAMRSSARKRNFNERRKQTMRVATKAVEKDTASGETKAKLAAAYQAIDKAAKRGVIKKNTAARKKSRLSALVKKSAK